MRFKKLDAVKVYRQDLHAAHLRRTKTGWELEFTSEFLASNRFNELTYTIPKRADILRQQGVNLPPFFAGLLPEGLRLRVLEKSLKTSADDLFTLLAATGSRTIGDVYIANPLVDESHSDAEIEIPQIPDIDLYEFFMQVTQSHPLQDESLPGVQEKISASMISLPIRWAKKHKSFILKINPKDKPNLIQNEFHCLSLAHKCGLRAAKANLVYDRVRNPALIVERFDRFYGKAGAPTLVHQEDACQFLDRYPADKYRISMQEIADGIIRLATAPQIEMMRLLQLYAFSYVIGNGDLHAKNISLQTCPESGRIQLTPAYDLICTYIYKDQKMALRLDGKDNNIRRSHLLKFALRHGLTEKATISMLDHLLGSLSKHKDLLLNIPMKPKDRSSFEKMFAERSKHLT